jgi:hypothetical protein
MDGTGGIDSRGRLLPHEGQATSQSPQPSLSKEYDGSLRAMHETDALHLREQLRTVLDIGRETANYDSSVRLTKAGDGGRCVYTRRVVAPWTDRSQPDHY